MKKFVCLSLISLGSVFVSAQSGGKNNLYQNTLNLVKRVPGTEVKPMDNFVSESDILAKGALDTYYNHKPTFKVERSNTKIPDWNLFESLNFGFGGKRGVDDFQNGIINGKKIFNVNRREDIRENIDLKKYYHARGGSSKNNNSK
uniref:hypothetical protein n=1 Tax=Ornithobacterium rhinotracheale TaxID=28251 RepID=UPI00129CF90F|nr:hypothetical protein [Ornithobacterium rhinotracheale]